MPSASWHLQFHYEAKLNALSNMKVYYIIDTMGLTDSGVPGLGLGYG